MSVAPGISVPVLGSKSRQSWPSSRCNIKHFRCSFRIFGKVTRVLAKPGGHDLYTAVL